MGSLKHNVADIRLHCASGTLEVVEFTVIETLSSIYSVKVSFKTDEIIPFEDLIDTSAYVELMAGPELDTPREFHGIVAKFVQNRTGHGNLDTATRQLYYYQVELRPEMWRLSKCRRSRVYRDKTTQDIVNEVLDEIGISNYSWDLNGTPRPRKDTVQYKESNLEFVLRLLEDDGIFFFFDHADSGKIVFGDHPGAHPSCTPTSEARYVEETSPRFAQGSREFVSDLNYEVNVGSGKFILNDYFHETSTTDLKREDTESNPPCKEAYAVYEHQARYTKGDEGATLATIRKEEEIADLKVITGRTTCRSFACGHTFTLDGHFVDALNRDWILYQISVNAVQGRYSCQFVAIPADVVFRPARVTPKPRIYGVQTGVVCGPGGEKVYLDKMGRAKVQFHWDRENNNDDHSSMWVRVSQSYAGKDYGTQWIPRIGHEVLVSFVDGDPDRPVITGRVYNDANTAPLGPSKKWQNIQKDIKDNHMMFDAEDGKELVDIRAQRNMNTLVVADKSLSVGGNESNSIGNNRDDSVGVNETRTVGTNQDVTVGSNQTVTVGAMQQIKVGAMRTDTVAADVIQNIGASRIESIGANELKTVAALSSLTAGAVRVETAGSAMTMTSGTSMDLSSGAILNATAGAIMELTSGSLAKLGSTLVQVEGSVVQITGAGSISISCGPSSINLSPAGVTISGPMVTLTGLVKHNC